MVGPAHPGGERRPNRGGGECGSDYGYRGSIRGVPERVGSDRVPRRRRLADDAPGPTVAFWGTGDFAPRHNRETPAGRRLPPTGGSLTRTCGRTDLPHEDAP